MTTTQPLTEIQTLDKRMAAGLLPVGEALRYAISMAESLHRLHEEGRVHSALAPWTVAIAGREVEILPGRPGLTPYTPPEVAQGDPPDARSDIFSFGAILYEMLTGEQAFRDGSRTPSASGSGPVDRVVQTCLAAEPGKRYQRIPKLLLELKLLAVAARRAEPPSPKGEDPVAVLRAGMRQLEERLAAQLSNQDLLRNDLVHYVGTALERIQGQLANGQQRSAALEQAVDSLNRAAAEVRETVNRDLESFAKSLKIQASTIDSARVAMAPTDNLVERVVEALEALQSIVLEGMPAGR